jgi:dTDP-4-amino-4,6-dideoxygalactose transaminase
LGPPDGDASWWFFPIRVSNPIAFEAFMADQRVAVGQVHARNDINPCFDGAIKGSLPGVDEFSAHQTNLPCGWFIDSKRLGKIVQAVERWSATDEARW